MDEQLNDAAMDFVLAMPFVPFALVAHVRRAFLPACSDVTVPTAPCRRLPRPTNVSAPIAS
eukprot:379663-Pleurochrysis_carterae.AAC.1